MLKKTKTREEIVALFEITNSPLNANDIFEKLRDKNITLSSIYRTLETFTNQGILIKDLDPKGTAIYTMKQEKHSHYLQCKNCNKKVELEYCPYHKVNDKISRQFDFEVDEHNVVIYGTCRNCNDSNKKC